MNSNEFDSAFWLTITGVLTAFISGSLVYVIKSKCSKCNFCFGLVNIERNVEVEEKIEELELERGISREETKK